MTVSPDDAWGVPYDKPQPPPKRGRPNPMTEVIEGGKWDVTDVEKEMLDAWAEKHNLQDQDWRK